MPDIISNAQPEEGAALTRKLTFLLAVSVAILVANLYYAQPLVAPISKYLGLSAAFAGLILTLTQVGYGMGVLFLVPLGDVFENRKLILSLIGLSIFAVLGLAFSKGMATYFFSAWCVGVSISVVQIIVPFASHLAPLQIRGRVVGNLMSGIMVGIMLSRPAAGFLTDLFSWNAVFKLSAGLLTILWGVLYMNLPKRNPSNHSLGYAQLLISMGGLLVSNRVLQRRALYQALIFASFCLFWTSIPLYLAGPAFGWTQSKIALFALVGVAGAVSAPVAGRFADRGKTGGATALALTGGVVSFGMTRIFSPSSGIALVILALSAILLDAGVSANLVLGQRAIFSLPSEFRGRLNGLYIAIIFAGGAMGSSLGTWAYERGGWGLASSLGSLLPGVALLIFFTEGLDRK